MYFLNEQAEVEATVEDVKYAAKIEWDTDRAEDYGVYYIITRFDALAIDGEAVDVDAYNEGEDLPDGVEEALVSALENQLEAEEAAANAFVDGVDYFEANDHS